jgi:phosphoribosylaminoimidazolecarboxamide formyltransferase/IMP cyclohydrolase
MSYTKIQRALISVFNKEGLDRIIQYLHQNQVEIYSTGGTQAFIEKLNIPVTSIESLTGYPSILGGRVKTLHPKVFGGILGRKDLSEDVQTLEQYEIPFFDLVIVDLYPFEDTIYSTTDEQAIIEKIDIGGVSLIRAAAKNFYHTLVCCSKSDYEELLKILELQDCSTDLITRKRFAVKAFATTSHYDTCIFNHFNKEFNEPYLRISDNTQTPLRYGENPHQKADFYGKLGDTLKQLNGKELSYNNILDIDASINLIEEFDKPAFAVIKHTNACGVAQDENQMECWKKALAGDPVSAFGGIIITNTKLQAETATLIDEIFFEVIIASGYDEKALEILKRKKNRIILERISAYKNKLSVRTALNGLLVQETDAFTSTPDSLKTVTLRKPDAAQIEEMIFAEKICKHLKSNTIVLTRGKQLLGMGCGQTSRVDALKQAIEKAKVFGFDLKGATMASDAFFPFPDCVEIAHTEGIEYVIQPGGSIKDQDSTNYCNTNNICMVHSGIRHFKH